MLVLAQDLGSMILLQIYNNRQELDGAKNPLGIFDFGRDVKSYASTVEQLQDSKLIKGVLMQSDGYEEAPFWANLDAADITPSGVSLLKERHLIE